MSIKNILAVIVLMCLGIYHVIQGEIIYGEHIARINVSAIAGKWFMVASTLEIDQSLCCTNDINIQSADNFTMHIVAEQNKDNLNAATTDFDFVLYARMKNNTNVISTTYDGGRGPSLTLFNVVYNSHMAMYAMSRVKTIFAYHSGVFMIFSRDGTLSHDILEKVRDSNFYQQAPKTELELQSIDYTACG